MKCPFQIKILINVFQILDFPYLHDVNAVEDYEHLMLWAVTAHSLVQLCYHVTGEANVCLPVFVEQRQLLV